MSSSWDGQPQQKVEDSGMIPSRCNKEITTDLQSYIYLANASFKNEEKEKKQFKKMSELFISRCITKKILKDFFGK